METMSWSTVSSVSFRTRKRADIEHRHSSNALLRPTSTSSTALLGLLLARRHNQQNRNRNQIEPIFLQKAFLLFCRLDRSILIRRHCLFQRYTFYPLRVFRDEFCVQVKSLLGFDGDGRIATTCSKFSCVAEHRV